MSDNQEPEGRENQQAEGTGGNQSRSPEQSLSFRQYLFVGAVVACITLVGFPLLALKITQGADCCFNDSLSNLMTFWGAVLAGFLALFGILISGLYIFTALRIDRGAKSEARNEAREVAEEAAKKWSQEEAKSFFERYRKDELRKLDDAVSEVESKASLSSQTMNRQVKHVEDFSNATQTHIEQASASVDSASQSAKAAAERSSELSASSEVHIREAVERARKGATAANDAAMEAKSAADKAEQSARMANESADDANVNKVVNEAKTASAAANEALGNAQAAAVKAERSERQAEQFSGAAREFAGEARKFADEAQEHARRASGGGSDRRANNADGIGAPHVQSPHCRLRAGIGCGLRAVLVREWLAGHVEF